MRIGVSSANKVWDANTYLASRACSGCSHQTAPPTQLARVERFSSTPCRAKIWLCRYSGRRSQYLETRTWASLIPALAGVARAHAIAAVIEDATRQQAFGIGSGCLVIIRLFIELGWLHDCCILVA